MKYYPFNPESLGVSMFYCSEPFLSSIEYGKIILGLWEKCVYKKIHIFY